jgi:1-deoxy-D-xylulose 5-phosphate reductoisomerase
MSELQEKAMDEARGNVHVWEITVANRDSKVRACNVINAMALAETTVILPIDSLKNSISFHRPTRIGASSCHELISD